ncbi:MAG: 2Fe-2S iron-sulfur cluster-binding protein, partial [Planctomycetota bacterium]
MTHCIVDFQPIGRRVEAQPGETLLQVAQQGGIGLAAVCGGAGTCGRCLVQVMSGAVSPLTEDERRRLSAERIAEGYRL